MNVFYYLGLKCENTVAMSIPVFALTKTTSQTERWDQIELQTRNLQIGK
jgi:hypothetical protein